jgi:hypothetical protein
MECHARRPDGAYDFTNWLGKGGHEMRGPFGTVTVRNITSHAKSGIGEWTNAEIKRSLTQGVSRDGRPFKPPMARQVWFSRMTETDLDAIVAYVRTVPPLEYGAPVAIQWTGLLANCVAFTRGGRGRGTPAANRRPLRLWRNPDSTIGVHVARAVRSINFGSGFHVAPGRAVDAAAYERFTGRWSRLFCAVGACSKLTLSRPCFGKCPVLIGGCRKFGGGCSRETYFKRGVSFV